MKKNIVRIISLLSLLSVSIYAGKDNYNQKNKIEKFVNKYMEVWCPYSDCKQQQYVNWSPNDIYKKRCKKCNNEMIIQTYKQWGHCTVYKNERFAGPDHLPTK